MHEEHGGFSLRRRPDLPVCNRGDSAADHAGLAAAEWHRAAATPGLSRDNSRRSVRLPNGMPRPSQIKWRLLPRLARSVGFAPVCGPQKLLAPSNYQRPHETSRSGHHEKANSATRSESSPKFRHAANRVNAANKSCQNRNPIVSAASARECHFEAQTQYLLGKLGRIHVVDHLSASALKLGEAVGLNSIAHREKAQRP